MAGLQFPVNRIASCLIEGYYAPKISSGTPIYLAAVLEYLCAELLELSGNAAKHSKSKRIIPRHINIAVRNDTDGLNKLFAHCHIVCGGVLPNIHQVLLPQKKSYHHYQPLLIDN